MTRIGLISDTHGFLDPRLFDILADVDEVWHAGDIGSLDVLARLQAFKPTRAVWGNADSHDIQIAVDPRPRFVFNADGTPDACAEDARQGILQFSVENVNILMTHIGGFPGHYASKVLARIKSSHPQVVVAGHSHILRVIYDKKYQCLHLNPGACGLYGIQTVRTALRFSIDGSDIRNMQIIELPRTSQSA